MEDNISRSPGVLSTLCFFFFCCFNYSLLITLSVSLTYRYLHERDKQTVFLRGGRGVNPWVCLKGLYLHPPAFPVLAVSAFLSLWTPPVITAREETRTDPPGPGAPQRGGERLYACGFIAVLEALAEARWLIMGCSPVRF